MSTDTIAENFDRGEANLKNSAVFNVGKDIREEWFYERKQWPVLVKSLVGFLKDEGRSHIFVIGTRGSGKTALVRYLLNQTQALVRQRYLERDFEFTHLNCQVAESSYKLMKAFIGPGILKGRPAKYDTTIQFHNSVKALPKKHVLVLDELDCLEDYQLFYNIGTFHELENLLVIGIGRTPKFFKKAPPDVLTRLQYERVYFDTYSDYDIAQILQKRAAVGLHACHPRLPLAIANANVVYANSDVRAGIKVLKAVAGVQSYVDLERLPDALVEDVQTRVQEEYNAVQADAIQNLGDVKLAVLYFCLKCGQSNTAYNEYAKLAKRPMSKVWFLHNVDELSNMDLLAAQRLRRGRSDIIQFNTGGELLSHRNMELVRQLMATGTNGAVKHLGVSMAAVDDARPVLGPMAPLSDHARG